LSHGLVTENGENEMDKDYSPIYPLLKEAGATMDNHESDLYVLLDEKSSPIIEAYNPIGASKFISQIDGKMWMDIPFAYLPYWEAKQNVK